MPTMKNMSTPRRTSMDMMRCVGVRDPASGVPGEIAETCAVGEASEDMRECCPEPAGVTSESWASPVSSSRHFISELGHSWGNSRYCIRRPALHKPVGPLLDHDG